MTKQIIRTDKLKEENGKGILNPSQSLLNSKTTAIIREEEEFKARFKETEKDIIRGDGIFNYKDTCVICKKLKDVDINGECKGCYNVLLELREGAE